tara:strand:- start:1583 stop:2116 length:534 start_codon:yes stop_codon:yes gene_type:complete
MENIKSVVKEAEDNKRDMRFWLGNEEHYALTTRIKPEKGTKIDVTASYLIEETEDKKLCKLYSKCIFLHYDPQGEDSYKLNLALEEGLDLYNYKLGDFSKLKYKKLYEEFDKNLIIDLETDKGYVYYTTIITTKLGHEIKLARKYSSNNLELNKLRFLINAFICYLYNKPEKSLTKD